MPHNNPRSQTPRSENAPARDENIRSELNERSRSESMHAEQPSAGATTKLRFGKIGLKNIKTGLRVQKEMFDIVQDIGRDWVARASSEAEMVLNLPNRLKNARSPSDALSAYRLWLSDWLRMCGEDGRRFVSDSQKIVDTGVRCLGSMSPAMTG